MTYAVMKVGWLCAVVLFFSMVFSLPALADNNDIKKTATILYLSNFSSQYYWNQTLKKQIRKRFKERGISLNFYEEVLDVRRKDYISRNAIFAILKKLYDRKYRNVKIDVIISSDDSLIGVTGRKLFPEIPFLFCYTRKNLEKRLHEMGNASATLDARSAESIIDIGIRMHPSVKDICVVSDYSEVSRFFSDQIMNMEKFYPHRNFVYICTNNKRELVEKLRQLSRNTFIVDTSYFSSPLVEFSYQKTKSIVFEASRLPVYSLWSNPVGNGVVAGLALDPRNHGDAAARLAMEIIAQGSAENILPVLISDKRVYFDYDMLNFFSISEDILPAGAIVLNKPPSFFERYRASLTVILFIILFFSIIISMLVMALRQKKREKKMLIKEIDVKNKEARVGEKLQQARKMEALCTFSLGIAHDLNGVLGSISACSQLAQQELSPETRPYEDLQQIDSATQRARELIKKISKGGAGGTKEPFPFRTVVDESIEIIRPQIPEFIDFIYENATTSLSVLLDPVEIHQILQNLCLNAVQAMDSHGRLRVCVMEDLDNDHVVISVADTGKGISEGCAERIFEPYFTTKKSTGGKGLGLFTVHNIITSISGKIEIKNEVGFGTCFKIALPIFKKISDDA